VVEVREEGVTVAEMAEVMVEEVMVKGERAGATAVVETVVAATVVETAAAKRVTAARAVETEAEKAAEVMVVETRAAVTEELAWVVAA